MPPSQTNTMQHSSPLQQKPEPVDNSDERLKKDISPLPDVLNKILLLQPKFYRYIVSGDANRFSYGFIAQEVEKYFPEIVYTDEKGFKSVAYDRMNPVLVEAIKAQQTRLIELESQQSQLAGEEQALAAELAKLESRFQTVAKRVGAAINTAKK